jgi:hypothetical protein
MIGIFEATVIVALATIGSCVLVSLAGMLHRPCGEGEARRSGRADIACARGWIEQRPRGGDWYACCEPC